MKQPLIFAAVIAFVIGCSSSDNQEQSQNDQQLAQVSYSSFGDEISPDAAEDVLSIEKLMTDKDSVEVKLTGEIDKTCKMKGCWMTVKTGDSTTMRVTFKDYGFFVPKEGMEGRQAIFQGKLSKSTTSVEVLRHYALDAGKSAEEINAITAPKEEFTFEATGVLIEDEIASDASK